MDDVIRSTEILNVFRTSERQFGCSHNYDADRNKYYHFVGRVKDRHFAYAPATKISEMNAVATVLGRGLAEIRVSDLNTVVDLIENGDLYRGEEFLGQVKGFRSLLVADKESRICNFVWANLP